MLHYLPTCDTMIVPAKVDTRAFASFDQKLHDVTIESLVVKDLPIIGDSRATLAGVQIPDDMEVFAFMDTKRCTKCGKEYPATHEYFHFHRLGKDGLNPRCKSCRAEDAKIEQKHRRVIPAPEQKLCRTCRVVKPIDAFARSCGHCDGYDSQCKTCANAWDRRYRAEHVERERERSRQKYIRRREAIRAYHREYNRTQKDKVRERRRRWANNNPEADSAAWHRRLARKRNLPANFTARDWKKALEYWHYCCAVCGSQRGFWNPLTADHWIPLSAPNCPGTVPENIVPLCKSCNSSKHKRNAAEWLIEKFGPRKANKIIKKVDIYFNSLQE